MREFHYHEETVQLICIVPLLFACGLKDKIEKLQIIPNGGEFNRKSDCPARPKRMGGYWRQNSGNTKAQDMDQNEPPPPPRSTGYRVLNITNIDTLRVSFFCCCLIIPLTYLPRGEEPKSQRLDQTGTGSGLGCVFARSCLANQLVLFSVTSWWWSNRYG